MVWYVLLIGVVTLERLAGLVVAKRNRTWSCARGGVEFGARHYPAMVALHTGLLAGCLVEVIALHRRFFPLLGWPMLAIVVVAQALRWWCIATLGHQWNTRVIVVANAARVTRGPYRFLPHPNYLAVVAEEVALPFGAHHVDHRTGVLDAQRVAVEDTDQSRKRCPGEPDVIDLLVVGGGPAGLATALHGARAGLEVVVVERRSGPIDKAWVKG